MKRIGLTGSIGMGKSTALGMFEAFGAAVWDADAAVRRLYAPGGAGVGAVAARFPEAIEAGGVDRARLSRLVLGEPAALAALEAIIHPLVAADREQAIETAREAGADTIVLDIPLLFETLGESASEAFDAIVVVTASAATQRRRVLARPGMSAEKFEAILARQTPDDEKRRRADYILSSDQSKASMREDARTIFAAILARPSKTL